MKKKMRKILALTALSALVTAGSAMATPFLPTSTTQMSEVQGVFNTIGSTINAVTDATAAEAFAPQSSGSTAEYVATVSYTWPTLEFGLYEIGNVSNSLTLFDKTVGSLPGDSTQIFLNFGLDVMVASYWDAGTSAFITLDTANYMSNFGFYGIGGEDITFYSESDLNNQGYDRFLTYEGNGDMVDVLGDGNPLNDLAHWYIAAELGAYGLSDPTTGDFSDIIVQMESVQPIPEPATMFLFGTGLAGFAALRRRKRNT